MNTNFDNKTILVTGGTGSIGSELVKQLLKYKAKKVIVFSRGEIKQFFLKQEIEDNRLNYIIGDIKDFNSLQTVFERNDVDIVFHTAAMKHLVMCENEPIVCSMTNIIGTHNLIRLCIKYGIKKTVTISTDKAASPTSVMGATKFIAERITLNANLLAKNSQRFCCARFGNVANSRGSVIPVMVDRLVNKNKIWVSHPDITRFIMRIPDAVSLVIQAAETTQGGEIFVLKMKSFKLDNLAKIMEKNIAPKLNKKINIIYKKIYYGEKLHEDLLNKVEFRNLLENNEMYIVLKDDMTNRIYNGFKKSSIETYDSESVEHISLKKLEEIIWEYILDKKYYIS